MKTLKVEKKLRPRKEVKLGKSLEKRETKMVTKGSRILFVKS